MCKKFKKIHENGFKQLLGNLALPGTQKPNRAQKCPKNDRRKLKLALMHFMRPNWHVLAQKNKKNTGSFFGRPFGTDLPSTTQWWRGSGCNVDGADMNMTQVADWRNTWMLHRKATLVRGAQKTFWDPRQVQVATDHLDFWQLRDRKDVHCHTHGYCLAWSWWSFSMGCEDIVITMIMLSVIISTVRCS